MRLQSNSDDNSDPLPPIRSAIQTSEAQVVVKNKEKRITSTDYNQWDKFDAGIYLFVLAKFILNCF